MITVKEIDKKENKLISEVVDIHLASFDGFFLSFMGKSFLKNMYLSYAEDEKSDVLVAIEDGVPVGFLSFTYDLDHIYKFMAKRHFASFAISCVKAFFKKPGLVFRRICRFVFGKDKKNIQTDDALGNKKLVKLSSIGVLPERQRTGIGSILIKELKDKIDFKNEFVSLDTDAENNEAAIEFYKKNNFEIYRYFSTKEGREMIEFVNKEAVEDT